jgi:hypothetical protein
MPCPVKNRRIRWIRQKDSAVLLDPKKGRYFRLNRTASVVWDCCDGVYTINAISIFLKTKFNIKDSERIIKDVKDIILYFYRIGLVSFSKSA